MKQTRRMGRPPLSANRCKVHLTLPCDLYDRAYASSRKNRVSIPEIIRRAMTRMLEDERGATLSL